MNSTGSSGAMESEVALKLTTKIFRESNGLVYVSYIVSDDDLTMRAHFQHESSGPKEKLDDDIPQPSFCADPSYRIKVMSKPIDEFVTKAKQAPVEHLFNDHQWCHKDWCWAKGLDNKRHEMICLIVTAAPEVSSPAPSTGTGGDGVLMISTAKVVNPAVCASIDTECEESAAAVVLSPSPSVATSGDGVPLPSTAEVVNPTALPYSDDDFDPYIEENSSDSGSDDEKILLESIDEVDEVNNNEYFSKIDIHDDAAKLFSTTEPEDMRKRELALMERNEKGYYRSKIEHAELYSQISAAYQPYTTKGMLEQLRHPCSTQENEAMNQSVAAYAPKGNTYYLTNSLDTRVCIAGSIQILGYLKFWTRVFHEPHIEMDLNLCKHLQSKDKVKKKKSIKHKE